MSLMNRISIKSTNGWITLVTIGTTASVLLLWWKKQIQQQRHIHHDNKTCNGRSCNKIDDHDDDHDTNDIIYMDYNGTTPVDPLVVNAMIPYFQQYYGNPNSSHSIGDIPRNAIRIARNQILTHILGFHESKEQQSFDPNEPICIFTGCGTESDNLAIHLAIQSWNIQKKNSDTATTTHKMVVPHIVTTNVEHPAIDTCLSIYEQEGRCTVTRVPVQSDGRVFSTDMIAAIQSNTALVTLMLANNETGALQPVQEVAQHCREHGILVATDAAQAVGKVSVKLSDIGDPDMVVLVGHKIGAPKGIACLYVRPGCLGINIQNMQGLLIGGGQEFGLRGGTYNVPYIVGLGVAAEHCTKYLERNRTHLETMRSRLLNKLIALLGDDNIRVNGPIDPNHRLPNTLSIGFGGGILSSVLLDDIRYKVAASAGATCHSASGPISSILQAMQVPEQWARGTVRLSLGPHITAEEIDRAATYIADSIQRQREMHTNR